jgi:hypothetical protein
VGRTKSPTRFCTVPECGRLHAAKSLCDMHYKRWQKGLRLEPLTTAERFWQQVEVRSPNECWPWTGSLNKHGYGIFKADGVQAAHVWIWQHVKGPVPKGYHVDHECHNNDPDCDSSSGTCPHRACANLRHLDAVPAGDNVRRGRGFSGLNARKTHCKNEHEFTPDNTYVFGDGCRSCRTCRNAATARYRARKDA